MNWLNRCARRKRVWNIALVVMTGVFLSGCAQSPGEESQVTETVVESENFIETEKSEYVPSDEELEYNSRAKSSKLGVFERIRED